MREFLDNPKFTSKQDQPRENNRRILIDFFDSWTTFEEFEQMGRFDELLYIAGIGSGKCLLYGTKVLMFDGSIKNVEDVKVGEQVMGDDNTPRNILTVAHGYDEMYKITPSFGEPFVVNSEHILSFKVEAKSKIYFGPKYTKNDGNIINMKVTEWFNISQKQKNSLKIWRLKQAKFSHKELPIDPYFLGLWLGDGNSDTAGISTADEEVKEIIYEQARIHGLQVTINANRNKTCPTYVITTGKNGSHGCNCLKNKLRALNLLKNKHIPLIYKTASVEQRLQLLAGLLDSDGHLGQTKAYYEFSNKNETLIDDTIFVSRSLGFRSNKSYRETTCRGEKSWSFRCGISGEINQIPCKILRKIYKKPRKSNNQTHLVRVKSIEKVGTDKYAGFSVDGNHLFCLGDFTITHNSFYSSKATQYIIHRLLCLKDPQSFYNKAKGTKIAFINISTSLAQAKDIVFGEIKNRIDNSPWFQENYPPDQKIKSVLRFPKSIYVLPVGSNEEAPLGYTIFGGIIDEASFHKMTKDKDYAEESYHQIKKRIASRFLKDGVRHGKMCVITSPRYVNDFAERKFREDSSKTTLKRRVPLWEAMPKDTFCGETFDIGKYLSEHKGKMCPIEYERDFIQSPERAMRDFGAQASLAIEAFFRDHNIINEKVNKERRHPFNKLTNSFEEWFYNRRSLPNYDPEKYYIHCDLGLNKGGKGDNAAIAMGRFAGWETYESADGKKEKRPLIKIAYMERISSGPKSEILFSEVRERIYKLKDIGYDIHKILFDGWQSIDSVQTLNSAGFDAAFFSVDRNPEAYHTLKAALLEGRLDYYYYKPFIEELQQLEEVKGNKIDHPRLGKKDVSDCVASICYHSAKGSSGSGVLLH